MDPSRRSLLRISLGLASAVCGAWTMRAQGRLSSGAHPPPNDVEPPMLWPASSPKLTPAELRDRVAEFRSCLDQLCQSAEALKKEVGGLQVTQVLSAKVYKDAESLEKLGKKVKALSKL
jgi:hypothetical protein